MRRLPARFLVGLAWSMALVSGCQPDRVAPPPGPNPSTAAEAEPARTFFFISNDPPEVDPQGWKWLAQREANLDRTIFRSLGPGPEGPTTDLPELIRRAVADGASALLVATDDSAGLPGALTQAEAKKVPVVLIGRPVAAPAGSPPFTVAAPEAFGPSADRLTSAALEDARILGRPAGGTALILAEGAGDPFAADRVAALRAAAEKAGLKPRVFGVDPPFDAKATATVTQAIQAAPDTVIVLADGPSTMQVASKARREVASRVKVAFAGYVNLHNAPISGLNFGDSATANYRVEELGRLAVRAALDRLRGGPPGRRVELALIFKRGQPTDPTTPDVFPRPIHGGNDPREATPRPPR
jgi:ABC-type sugar transport system substrate-binding protein